MKIPLKPVLKWIGRVIAAAAIQAAAERLTRRPTVDASDREGVTGK